MNIITGDRVKMPGTHYVGTVQWVRGAWCGVRWDGFTGTEHLTTDRVEKV